MNRIARSSNMPDFPAFVPARTLAADTVPWVPLPGGKSFKPLRFLGDDRGFVELLRLEPGEAIPLHRHSGETHAFNLEGSRQLDTGEVIGPGGYVHEPAGSTDAWKVIGDVPLIVLVVVTVAVEYLGPDGIVTARYTARTLMDIYGEHCKLLGIEPLDLAG